MSIIVYYYYIALMHAPELLGSGSFVPTNGQPLLAHFSVRFACTDHTAYPTELNYILYCRSHVVSDSSHFSLPYSLSILFLSRSLCSLEQLQMSMVQSA